MSAVIITIAAQNDEISSLHGLSPKTEPWSNTITLLLVQELEREFLVFAFEINLFSVNPFLSEFYYFRMLPVFKLTRHARSAVLKWS